MYYTDQEVLDFVVRIRTDPFSTILSEERTKEYIGKIEEADLIGIPYHKNEINEKGELFCHAKIQYFVRVSKNVFTDDRIAVDMKLAERRNLTIEKYFEEKFNERIKNEKSRIEYLKLYNIEEEYKEITFSYFLKTLYTKTEIL